MASFSKLTVIGCATTSPRFVSYSGVELVTFPVAVVMKWMDKKTGEKKECVEWYECVSSQRVVSSVIKNYVKKGVTVYVEGKPSYRLLEGKNGEQKIKITININTITLLEPSKQNEFQKDVNGNLAEEDSEFQASY